VTHPTPDSFAQRLNQLENDCHTLRRANGRWRRLSTALVVSAGALVFMGQGGSGKTVQAEEIKLVKNGKMRALLAVDDSNQVSLSLLGPAERVRALFSVTGKGKATFSFVDPDGSIRATFSQAANGKPGLALLEKDGSKRVALSAEPSGILISDTHGKTKAAIVCKGEGKGILQIRDASGKASFTK
jgi:hypothetical protein